MPKLPTEDSLSAVVPRPSRGFVAIEPAPLDRSWEGLGEIGQLIDKEFDRIEDLRVNDALNQLRQRRIELSQGEAGFAQKKGAAVVNEPVLDNFQGAFSREIDTIGGNLRTGRARTAFQQRAAQEANAFQMDLLRHVSAQTDAYQESVFAATMENGARTIVLEATKPADVLAEVGKLSDAIEAELDRRGFEAGTPEAEKVREAFRQEALGGALTTAVATLLAEDRTAEAQRIFNEYEKMGAFTAKQIAQIKPKLQSAKDWTVGAALGERAYQMRLEGKSVVDVERFLNNNAKSQTELNSARVAYGRFEAAKTEQWNENAKTALEEMIQISGDKYDPSSWFQIRSKYVDRLSPDTIISLDAAADKVAKGERITTDWALYEELINEAYRPSTSDKFLSRSFQAEYGDRLAPTELKQLIALQASMVQGKGQTRVETVTRIINNIAAVEGWQPGKRPKDKEKVGKFSAWLAEEVRKEMVRTDRPFVPESRINELARRGLEQVEYEEAGMLYGTNKVKKPRFEYEIDERDGNLNLPPAQVRARSIPAQISVEIRQVFVETYGRAPTPAEMVQYYEDLLDAQQGRK